MKKEKPFRDFLYRSLKKTLLIMRIAIFLLILGILQAHAVDAYSQKTRLSLDFTDTELIKVLDNIEVESEFFFLYNEKLLDTDRKVTIAANDQLITNILDNLFAGTDVKYSIIDRKIILAPDYLTNNKEIGDLSQQQSITGKVTDSQTGEVMPGVNILVIGTSLGAITDASGRYSITVTERNATLRFSFIGYVTQEIALNGRSTVDVNLISVVTGLDEVVVVGYGTQKRLSLTSSVSSVDGERLTEKSVADIQRSLQGLAPGLTVIDYGGSPGNSNLVMRIRGITTLGSNDPLVIVDGIDQPLRDLNPQDIESISILKDASSTAIYGSRAANGVILITTKRARSGKLSVSYNGSYALQKNNNNPEAIGLEDYMRFENQIYINSTGNPKYTEEYIQEYITGNATDPIKYPLPYDWHRHVLHTAPQINHSLSIQGGNETLKSVLTIRHLNQEGIIPNSYLKMTEVRLNNDYKVTPKINVGLDLNFRHRDYMDPISLGNVFSYMHFRCAWTVPKYPDGTYGISADGNNPLMYAEIEGTSKSLFDKFIGNFKLEWDLLKGLKFTTQLSPNLNLTTQKNYSNKYQVRDYYNPDLVKKNVPVNSLTETRNYGKQFTINNLLNYTTTLGNNTLNILAGYSEIKDEGKNLSAYRQGFYNNELQSISQGTNDATKSNSGSDYIWGLRSFFGRINYSFKDKYFFEANSRYDGSSRFTGDNRYSFFPSFSAGWRISQEKFWSGISNFVNELKLRASWGKSGNQAVSLYTYYPTLNLVTYSFGGAAIQGYRQTNLVDENITWETTTQSNIGLDIEFLDDRISAMVDYYYKKTDGILLTLPVPGTVGLNPCPQNAGRMDNKGWEFLIRSTNLIGQLTFNFDLNFNINTNTVVDLVGTGPYLSTGDSEIQTIIGEGYSYQGYWGFRSDGYFQTEEEILNYPTFLPGTKPGDVKYLDLNNDDKIDAGDKTYLGPTFPRYTFGSNWHFNYKNYSLNLLFQGAAGAKVQIGGAIDQMGNWGGFIHKEYKDNCWTPENPNAKYPRQTLREVRNTQLRDEHLQDGAYLRLKNIQLMYQIPTSLINKVGIQQLSVYLAGTDLITFSKLNIWNVDPETERRRAEGQYPQTALYTFGLNIQF